MSHRLRSAVVVLGRLLAGAGSFERGGELTGAVRDRQEHLHFTGSQGIGGGSGS